MIYLKLRSMPKNNKRVMSEVYHNKHVCRFELSDDYT